MHALIKFLTVFGVAYAIVGLTLAIILIYFIRKFAIGIHKDQKEIRDYNKRNRIEF